MNILTEKYKNALKGFKAQAQGTPNPKFFESCDAEAQHIYRIIMTENVPVTELDEATLESFLRSEQLGEKDYSKPVDRDGLKYVDFEQDVEIYPYKPNGHPIEDQMYLLAASDVVTMMAHLFCTGRINMITDTIQSLSQRKDGTLLQTAFPSLDEVKTCVEGGLPLPDSLIAKLKEWEELGASEVNFDFVELS